MDAEKAHEADRVYVYSLERAILILATALADAETDRARKTKKKNAVRIKTAAFDATHKDLSEFNGSSIEGDLAIRLCVDLAFCEPFSPYDLAYSERDFQRALVSVCQQWGITETAVDAILKDKKRLTKIYRNLDLKKVALMSAVGIAIFAGVGLAAAPVLGGLIGGGAGLSGAAATGFGLAWLGGGSLAAGGAGMSGGLWLVTGVGAATGAVGGGTAAFIGSLAVDQLKLELVKLQVTVRQVEATRLSGIAKAQEVIARLEAQREALAEALAAERELNDKNSERLRSLEAKIFAIRITIKQMNRDRAAEKQLAAAGSQRALDP